MKYVLKNANLNQVRYLLCALFWTDPARFSNKLPTLTLNTKREHICFSLFFYKVVPNMIKWSMPRTRLAL